LNERVQATEAASVPYGVVWRAGQAAAVLKLHPHYLGTLAGHGGGENRTQTAPRPHAHSGPHKLYGYLSGLGSDKGSGDETGIPVVRGPAEALADFLLLLDLDPAV
jgi:hypothetical protein